MSKATHRTERILREITLDLPGSTNAKGYIKVKYGEQRVYVHVRDCYEQKEIVWRFEYSNELDKEKLRSIINLFGGIDLSSENRDKLLKDYEN